MREYNEDPVFWAITAPETFAARRAHDLRVRRYVRRRPGRRRRLRCVERIALGGTSQGGVFEARRSTKAAAATSGRGQQAELWGDEQWQVAEVASSRNASRGSIGINRSTVFAFSDGLSSGELQRHVARRSARTWTARFKDAEKASRSSSSPSRLPEEEAFFTKMQELVWSMTQTMFSSRGDHAGQDEDERSRLVVAAARQRPGPRDVVPAEHRGAAQGRDPDEQLGDDPVIQRGDLLHCDVGITVARLNTDTQHDALRAAAGRDRRARGPPPRARQRQRAPGHRHGGDHAGRSGNEILTASRARMKAKGIDRHGLLASDRRQRPRRRTADRPVGLPGRRAGPRRREGHPEHVVLDRAAGDDTGAGVGRPAVRMAQEEDAIVGAAGRFAGRFAAGWLFFAIR